MSSMLRSGKDQNNERSDFVRFPSQSTLVWQYSIPGKYPKGSRYTLSTHVQGYYTGNR